MSKREAYEGLCSDCPRAAVCTYPRNRSRPVIDCCEYEGHEECEGSVSLSLINSGYMISRRKAAVDAGTTEEKEPPADKGLCAYCAIRYMCSYPKPEGGIWHCNEYL